MFFFSLFFLSVECKNADVSQLLLRCGVSAQGAKVTRTALVFVLNENNIQIPEIYRYINPRHYKRLFKNSKYNGSQQLQQSSVEKKESDTTGTDATTDQAQPDSNQHPIFSYLSKKAPRPVGCIELSPNRKETDANEQTKQTKQSHNSHNTHGEREKDK